MLVLSRHIGEKVVIGNGIIVEVLSVSGEAIRLGISAPRETSVHRGEVFDEIQTANRAASSAAAAGSRTSIEDLSARLRKHTAS